MVAAGARLGGWVGRSALAAPLQSPSYRAFWSANALNQAADQLQIVALAILALDLTHSAATLGIVLTAQAVPRTLLMLVGGVVADRIRPRTVLLTTSTGLALLGAALTLLTASGAIQLWHLYAYGLLAGTLYAFAMPSQQAIVPSLVPPERVRSALALNSTTFNMMMFLVPPAAGVLVSQAGVVPAFALNGAAFALAALRMSTVRGEATHKAAAGGAIEQMRDGLSVVRRDAVLLVATVAATVFSLGFAGVTQVGIPSLAKLELMAGDRGVGVLFGASGLGALVGAVSVGAMSRVPRQGLVATVALIGMGTGLAAVASSPTIEVAAVLLFAGGVARAVTAVCFLTIVQTHAPAEMRGRVMALFMLGVNGLAPLSLSVGGLMGDWFGPRGIFLAGGLAILAAGAFTMARPAFRRVD